jgi:hypothetical protein
MNAFLATHLICVRKADGRVQWQRDIAAEDGPPAVNDENLFVRSGRFLYRVGEPR